jgi:hypothetical protein
MQNATLCKEDTNMNNPKLVGFTCPNCHKVILHTLPSAKVYCGPCHQWACQVKSNITTDTTSKVGVIDHDRKKPAASAKYLLPV